MDYSDLERKNLKETFTFRWRLNLDIKTSLFTPDPANFRRKVAHRNLPCWTGVFHV